MKFSLAQLLTFFIFAPFALAMVVYEPTTMWPLSMLGITAWLMLAGFKATINAMVNRAVRERDKATGCPLQD